MAPLVVRRTGMLGVQALRFTARLLAAVVVSLLVVGCGDREDPAEPAAQPGRLVVHKSLVDSPIFIEGSVTQLRIVGANGAKILDELAPVDTLDEPLVDRPVPPGTYAVTAVERPCEGNCSRLDPPVGATRCELDVVVEPERTTRVAIVLAGTPEGVGSDCSAKTSAR